MGFRVGRDDFRVFTDLVGLSPSPTIARPVIYPCDWCVLFHVRPNSGEMGKLK